MSDSIFLFVYGSLRRNGSHNHLLDSATWLSQAHTKGKLFVIDWYPGLILDIQEGSSQNVVGDVYQDITPNLFAQLDRYEGDAYDRKIIQVTTNSGSTLYVHAYIYNQDVTRKKTIVSADWLKYLKEQPSQQK